MKTRPFKQVDVFTDTPYLDNPLAMVLGGYPSRAAGHIKRLAARVGSGLQAFQGLASNGFAGHQP